MSNQKNIIPNSFGIEARCRRFIDFGSEAELLALLPTIDPGELLLIVGRGCNLLPTGDFAGTVLHSSIPGMQAEKGQDGISLRCGSGVEWDAVVSYCVEQGIYGTENLALIPGDVGASAVQNIGAYGAEAKDIIERVEAIEIATGRRVTFTNADCGYAYRHSRFKAEWKNRFVITYVTYRLSDVFRPRLDYGNIRTALAEKGISEPTAGQLRDTIVAIRREKLPDPHVTGNAGSFFMNPVVERSHYERLAKCHPGMPHYDVGDGHVKIPAAWLIEQCGWKGRSVGRAGVYERQPLVLVNRGGATGQEVLYLCRLVQHDVSEQFGIEIKPEVNIV